MALLDHRGIARAHLVGHSGGGTVAAKAASCAAAAAAACIPACSACAAVLCIHATYGAAAPAIATDDGPCQPASASSKITYP